MPYSPQRTWSRLPVTALCHVSQCNTNFLLSGHGSVIKIWNLSLEYEQKELLLQKQVFGSQCIHAIKVHKQGDGLSSLVLIWGGRSIVLAQAAISLSNLGTASTKVRLVVGLEVHVADWILDAEFAISTSVTSNLAYLVTAHNSVFRIQRKHSNSLALNVSRLTDGPKSILYSACIKPISGKDILIAAGTVLGDVILWQSHQREDGGGSSALKWSSHVRKVFRGHQGSIFGVSLSGIIRLSRHHAPQRFLVSCSDDRTIRIWNATGCHQVPSNCLASAGELAQTAFPNIQKAYESTSLAVTWAHQSRIWGVGFLDDASSQEQNLIFSTGEDATCHLWDLRLKQVATPTEGPQLTPGKLQLYQVTSDHFHFGKHIWSLAYHLDGSALTVLTGGSDGAIIQRVSQRMPNRHESGISRMVFSEIFDAFEGQVSSNTSSGERQKDSVKQYVFLTSDSILATTDHGQIIQGTFTGEPQQGNRKWIEWALVFSSSELRGFAVLASDPEQQCAYIGSTVGNIWIYQFGMPEIQLLTTLEIRIFSIFVGTPNSEDGVTSLRDILVCSNNPSIAVLLQVSGILLKTETSRLSRSSRLILPPTFQPTAFLNINNSSLLVIGSRSGAVAVFQTQSHRSDIDPIICVRHIHHSDTVTCLKHLCTSYDNETRATSHQILSTGRDGSYSIHRIMSHESSATTLTALHRSMPSFGPCVEGANVITTAAGAERVLLHGFSGTDFVVWDEPSGQAIMTIPCGGAHRNWAFEFSDASKRSMMTLQAARFVWTKAGVLNMIHFIGPSHVPVEKGGHGREIKAMALSDSDIYHDTSVVPSALIVATGAEDTCIRLWHLKLLAQQAETEVSCQKIMRNHTTGVQQLAFLKSYLFSSAGFEELFIWKINVGVAGVGIGVVFQTALPKNEPVSDLRITSFEVCPSPRNQEADPRSSMESFLIYAAYSNSMVRVFKYSNDHLSASPGRFDLLGEGFYNKKCLTQLCLMPVPCSWFLTTSTNGAIAVWPDVGDVSQEQDSPVKLSYAAEYFIHQNAILALRMVSITPRHHLILTCGDDNAIGISMSYQRQPSPSQSRPGHSDISTGSRLQFGTLLLPKSHAAAVTALEILNHKTEGEISTFAVVSTGNDQLVKIWRITVDISGQLATSNNDNDHTFRLAVGRSINVQLLKHVWSNVADASCMAYIPDEISSGAAATTAAADDRGSAGHEKEDHDRCRIIVAGIGMEMLSIEMEAEQQ